jgi:hypothetical protein
MKRYLYLHKAACLSGSALLTIACLQAQPVMKVKSGTVIATTGGSVITLKNMSLDNDGSISQGRFAFTGADDNTISGGTLPQFEWLQIAKTGAAKLILQRNIRIGSSVNFTSGYIDLNNNTLLLQSTASLVGESATSHLIGDNGGYVEITALLNAPVAVNPGNMGIVFTATQNLGNTTIRRGHFSQVLGGSNGNSIKRYYDIVPDNNVGLNATLSFQYQNDELNMNDEGRLTFWKSTDNTTWTSQGFSARDTVANQVSKTGINDFSRWTLASANIALPVRFSLFNVHCNGSGVTVTWKTAQEQNASHFVVERSTDGVQWAKLATIKAAGNSTVEQSYAYNDVNALPGAAMYRVAEYDADGRSSLTRINKSDCNSSDAWKVWPNPVQETLWLAIAAVTPSMATVKIVDGKGTTVKTYTRTMLAGNNQLSVNLASLPAGMYLVVATWNNGAETRTVNVVKTNK